MIKTIKTSDYDQLCTAQEDWEIHYSPTRTDRFEGHLTLGQIGGVQIDLERWNTELELTGSLSEQHAAWTLPFFDNDSYLSKSREITQRHIESYGAGEAVDVILNKPTAIIACTLCAETLNNRSDSPLVSTLIESLRTSRLVHSADSSLDDLRCWWARLLALCADDHIPTSAHDRLFDETLLITARALSSGEDHRQTRPSRRYQLARRARDFMLDRLSNPPTIPEVCAFLTISERTLHKVFSVTYGVSPKQFLKAHRLFAVNHALKSPAGEESISDIAMRLGFWELGYFARDYRKMFGELPSETLRATRT